MESPGKPAAGEPSVAGRVIKVAARMGVFLGVLYAAWCAAFYVIQTRMIFPRQLANLGARDPRPEGYEEVQIEGRGGTTVRALFRRTLMASKDRPMPAVMLFQGNAELAGNLADLGSVYSDAGFSVLIAEYRGYGGAAGEPSQAAIVSDMCDAYDYLSAREDVRPDRVVLHGRSIGGAVAAQVAAHRACAALVLQSTMTSVTSIASRYLVPAFLVKHPFRTDRALTTFVGPVLLLHGIEDEIVPVSNSRVLHAIAPGSTLVELEGSHNDFPRDPGAYLRAIGEFLRINGLAAGK